MSQITFTGPASGTGTVNISAPVTNIERNLTLPDMSGTITAASSGTPDATTFLRGDGAWVAVSSAPTTAQVLDATAAATAGAVGTYCVAFLASDTSISPGATIAGSSLRAVVTTAGALTTALTGTWRFLGGDNRGGGYPSSYLRVS